MHDVSFVKPNMVLAKLLIFWASTLIVAQHGSARLYGNFSTNATKTTICDGEVGDILKQLRSEMTADLINKRPLQAYIIPMNDAHQNEYIAEHDKRLEYITKFTGSAGEAVVTADKAILWTDSRYHLQAEQQLDWSCWGLMKQGNTDVPSLSEWLTSNLEANSTVGVDDFLMTAKKYQQFSSALRKDGHELISIRNNLVDAIWTDRPVPIKNPIIPLGIRYSGKESGTKITELLNDVKKEGAESIVISALDDIAWLLNLRGSDIQYNPLFFSYILISPMKSYFFVDQNQLGNEAKEQMRAEQVDLIERPYEEILGGLDEIVNGTSGKIIISSSASQALSEAVPIDRRVVKDIVSVIKSIKNPIEAANMEIAHIRDGLALIQYLHWLNATIDSENVTELSGAKKLSQFRSQQENFRGISFEVISAVGANAAMAHYSPTLETAKRITRKEMYLVDSGGHYWEGTTDITRTVHFGIPTAEEKLCYTLVLKGFIALVTSIFPRNTQLSYLDHVARRPLWQAGLDYGHGTGHGVGMYLSVHEYPPLIHAKGTETLKENIFTSNEPGYYKDNEFGIRIEDVIQVIQSNNSNAFGGQGGLTFRSITYAPLQNNLIDVNLLTKEEIVYVNLYNHVVRDTIGLILLKHRIMDAYHWLVQETSEISATV